MLAFRNRRRHRRRRFTRRGPVGDPSTGRRICLPDASFQSRDPLLMSAACSSTTRPFFPFFHLLLLPSLFFLFFFFFFFVFNLKLGKKKRVSQKKGISVLVSRKNPIRIQAEKKKEHSIIFECRFFSILVPARNQKPRTTKKNTATSIIEIQIPIDVASFQLDFNQIQTARDCFLFPLKWPSVLTRLPLPPPLFVNRTRRT